MTHEEQPWRKIDRKWAFGQCTSATEVKEAHPKSARMKEVQQDVQAGTQEERLCDAPTGQAQAEEIQEEKVDIDLDYDLTKSPWDPIENYLGSEQEVTLVTQDQPVLHNPLPRYVTETKYLIDLVPTKEVTAVEKQLLKPCRSSLLQAHLPRRKQRMEMMMQHWTKQTKNILNKWR